MEVTPDIKGETLVDFADKRIVPGAISSDAYRSYRALASAGFKHEYQVYDAKKTLDHLHWLHTVLSNAKALVRWNLSRTRFKASPRLFRRILLSF